MKSATAGGRDPLANDNDAAIRVGLTAREQAETRWGLILVIYMRLLAVLWLAEGLMQWAAFLLPKDALFDHLRLSQSAAVMFFAVVDLIAAVGLWLATPWGAILWLIAALAQVFVAISVPNVVAPTYIASDVVLIVLYLVLTWQAGRASHSNARR